MHQLEEILSHYGVEGNVEGEGVGPLIRQIRFKPKPGTKIKTDTSAFANIAYAQIFNAHFTGNVINS